MKYPESRLRRLRYNDKVRELVEDVSLSVNDLIYPIFICEGTKIKNEIKTLPGQFQLSIDNALKLCEKLLKSKIKNIIVFGISEKKDDSGEISCNQKSIVPKAIKEIKKEFKDQFLVIADVCNCSYTEHGHCGTIVNNEVDNDLTIETLARQSKVLVESGADVLAPSDMMDGRVQLIRKKLDESGYVDTPIFPYSVKYASSFYGPFRDAVGSSPKMGDRKSYQMNFKNSFEFIREIEQDLNEGCDAIIIKPALAYLDIISRVKNKFNVPIIAYNVSGEYSMVKAGNQKNYIDEKSVMMEIMYSIKRAGANSIITYHALEIAEILKNNEV
jgi:porphobilinogen synthase